MDGKNSEGRSEACSQSAPAGRSHIICDCGYQNRTKDGPDCKGCGKPLAAPKTSQRPEVGSSTDWMDALAQELAEAEKRMDEHFKNSSYHYWEGVCNGILTAIDAMEKLQSASIGRDSRRETAQPRTTEGAEKL